MRLGLAVSVGLAVALAPAQADTFTAKPVADTTLFQSNPGNNLGKSSLAAGTTRNVEKSRALVRFDLSSLPANAVVSSATVSFKVIKAPSGAVGSTFELRRVLVPWSEGAKGSASQNVGGPAAAGEATWVSRGPANWSAAGGATGTDFAATASATKALSGTSLSFASAAALVSDVQGWITAPASNAGWVLLSQSEATPKTARRFGSRETANNEPTLTVTYTVPALPQPVVLEAPQRVGDKFSFTFAAEANQPYTVEFGTALQPGSWQVLRTFPAVAQTQVLTVEDSATEERRSYRVRSP